MECYIKDYPRPQFVRKSWENLNGEWDFRFDDGNAGERERWYEDFHGERSITVPFTYETKASGIADERRHDVVWYGRALTVEPGALCGGKRLLLHFEGSDFLTKLWVNGQFAGSHAGGYERFSFDITELVREGENRLTVRVEDSFDARQPRGKQRWIDENFGCWYVQTTGIWKTVWTEIVPALRLDRVKMTPDLQKGALEVEAAVIWPQGEGVRASLAGEGSMAAQRNVSEQAGGADAPQASGQAGQAAESKGVQAADGAADSTGAPQVSGQGADASLPMLEAVVSYKGKFVTKAAALVRRNPVHFSIDMNVIGELADFGGYRTWSPQSPDLYDIAFTLRQNGEAADTVGSYFGMREIRIEGQNILLNGIPLYQRLILDQGYWEDSHLTPPSEEALLEDIDKIHALGYNGLRKHQKIEDERFLYWCDVKGMLVWSEAAAAYDFSDGAIAQFTREWMEIVAQNYNHPSIITWTPFNESWGIQRVKTDRRQQHFTESIYHLTKSVDPMRPVIVNDGWEHTVSDIITLHDYEADGERFMERYIAYGDEILAGELAHSTNQFALANGFSYRGQPVIISEFGGIAFADKTEGWGYGEKVEGEDAFIKRFDSITTAIKEVPYICGYCYTQVTDVQQEINGLMDMRRRFKVDPDKIREINERQVTARRREC